MTATSRTSIHTDAPSDALIDLLAPDGYYRYLEVPKPSASDAINNKAPSSDTSDGSGSRSAEHNPLTESVPSIDEDLVKKNYRKLSRKHHPDRPGGDAATFRLLNRAKRVLLNTTLRHQYDILGLDIGEDEEEEDSDYHHDIDEKEGAEPSQQNKERPSTSQGIIQEIASMALTFILQLAVRTFMMAAVAVVVVRYRLTLYPALAFLTFIAFRIFQQSHQSQSQSQSQSQQGSSFTSLEFMSPVIISAGLLAMHNGRRTVDGGWTVFFWFGEAIVIAVFTYNSATALPKTSLLYLAIFLFATLSSLWFRGSAWNYATVVGLELFLVAVVALTGPILEFILDAILNEKLRKVGDKVRAHHEILETYYKAKMEKLKQKS